MLPFPINAKQRRIVKDIQQDILQNGALHIRYKCGHVIIADEENVACNEIWLACPVCFCSPN